MFYESRLLYIKVIKIIKKKCLYGTIHTLVCISAYVIDTVILIFLDREGEV